MSTGGDTSDPGPERQPLVTRLARSATSAVDTRDLSLSDTVARRVMNRTRDSSEVADESRLRSLVGEVTRHVVVSKAALIESLLTSGSEPWPEDDPALSQDESFTDAQFEAAHQQLATLCQFVRRRLQSEDWYLFRRRFLEETSWTELATAAGILDETGTPDEQAAQSRLQLCCARLQSQFAAEKSTGDSPQRSSLSHAATESEGQQPDDECPFESLLTWGLTDQQLRLATRSLPWVKLTPVDAVPPALPLKEPLLVSVTQSDAYLDWAADAEQSGTRVEPVVMLLDGDGDRLPPRLWGYTNGTVTPGDWSRAEELLSCSRLIESESAAHCVQLSAVTGEAVDVRTQPASQLQFDDSTDAMTVSHLDSCVTCRVAFNDVLEDRLQIFREHALALGTEVRVAETQEPGQEGRPTP